QLLPRGELRKEARGGVHREQRPTGRQVRLDESEKLRVERVHLVAAARVEHEQLRVAHLRAEHLHGVDDRDREPLQLERGAQALGGLPERMPRVGVVAAPGEDHRAGHRDLPPRRRSLPSPSSSSSLLVASASVAPASRNSSATSDSASRRPFRYACRPTMCADNGAVANWITTTAARNAITCHSRSEIDTAMQMRMSPSTCGLVAACRREGTSRSRSSPIAAMRHSSAPSRMRMIDTRSSTVSRLTASKLMGCGSP